MTEALISIPDWLGKCSVRYNSGHFLTKNQKVFIDPNTNESFTDLGFKISNYYNMCHYNDECTFCLVYDILRNSGFVKSCHTLKCPLCKVKPFKTYMLRGVCKSSSWIADIYYYLSEAKNFIGRINSRITWSQTSSRLKKYHNIILTLSF